MKHADMQWRTMSALDLGAVETIAANRDATHPRVVATPKGTLTLWFEGQPWSGAKLLANGRAIESATP